jgi:hypothetical protein
VIALSNIDEQSAKRAPLDCGGRHERRYRAARPTGFCNLYGSHTPFPPSQVQQLYPNHQHYVQAVREVTQKNLRDRFIVGEDAAEIIDAAEDSTIGTNAAARSLSFARLR